MGTSPLVCADGEGRKTAGKKTPATHLARPAVPDFPSQELGSGHSGVIEEEVRRQR